MSDISIAPDAADAASGGFFAASGAPPKEEGGLDAFDVTLLGVLEHASAAETHEPATTEPVGDATDAESLGAGAAIAALWLESMIGQLSPIDAPAPEPPAATDSAIDGSTDGLAAIGSVTDMATALTDASAVGATTADQGAAEIGWMPIAPPVPTSGTSIANTATESAASDNSTPSAPAIAATIEDTTAVTPRADQPSTAPAVAAAPGRLSLNAGPSDAATAFQSGLQSATDPQPAADPANTAPQAGMSQDDAVAGEGRSETSELPVRTSSDARTSPAVDRDALRRLRAAAQAVAQISGPAERKPSAVEAATAEIINADIAPVDTADPSPSSVGRRAETSATQTPAADPSAHALFVQSGDAHAQSGETARRRGGDQRHRGADLDWVRRSSTLESRLVPPTSFTMPTMSPQASLGHAIVPPTLASLPAFEMPAPQENLSRLIQSIRLQTREGLSEASVRLNPEHLGPVAISIRVDNGTVTAVVRAEAADVRQWLRGQEEAIRQSLAEQGLSLDQLVVEEDARGRQEQHREAEEQQRRRTRNRSTVATFEVDA